MLENQQDDYEGSYGSKVEKYYLDNKDRFDSKGYTPEVLAQQLFKKGRNVSEGDTYDTWAQRNKIDRFSQNISAFETKRRQEELDNQEREKNLAERGDFMRGAAAGVDQMQATVGGGLLMGLGKLASYAGGDNVVSKYLTNKGFDVYQEQMRQASLNPTKSLLSQEEGKWINEDLQGPGDYFDAIAGTLGNLVPSMAVSLISGGVGGKLAELAGRKAVDKAVGYFVKNQAERMMNKRIFSDVAKEATEAAVKSGMAVEAATLAGTEASRKVAQVAAQKYVGSRVGTIMGTAALETTGAFSDTVNHMRDKFMAEGMSHEDALLKATEETSATFAMSTGLAAGMVEIFGGNIRLLDMFLGDVGGKTAKELVKAATHARANPGLRGKALNMMRDIMVEAVKQAPAEFGQEAAQEILSMANVNFADPDFEMVSQENFKRVVESGLAGAIGGFGGGMATQVGSKAKAAFGTQETPESRARDLDVIIKRQESIIALGQEKSLPGVTAALETNRAERAELEKHLSNKSQGVSYQEAAKQINEALPNPSGKPFTVKSLKNLIRHGNLSELERGTVDATALQDYITARKPAATTAPAPAATTQAPQASQSTVDSVATQEAIGQQEVPGRMSIEEEQSLFQAEQEQGLELEEEVLDQQQTTGQQQAPSVPPRVTLPGAGWVNSNAQQNRDHADRLGVTEEIEDLFAQGLNVAQVQSKIKDKLKAIPGDEHAGFIVGVRATLGIPSQQSAEGKQEFADWQNSRNQRKLAAIQQTTGQQEPPVQAPVEEKKSLLQMEQELTQETSQQPVLEDQEYVNTTETEVSEKENVEKPASPNSAIFESRTIPQGHVIEQLGENEVFVYSQDQDSQADLKGSAKAAAKFEAEGGKTQPIRMRRPAMNEDGSPKLTEKGHQVFEYTGTQEVFRDLNGLAEAAEANPDTKFALPEMGRKAGVHPRVFRAMVNMAGLSDMDNVATAEQLQEKEKAIPLTANLLEEMERLSFGIQQGRSRSANTMATEEQLAKLQAGALSWVAEQSNAGAVADGNLVRALIQNIDTHTRAASAWMKYRNKQSTGPKPVAEPTAKPASTPAAKAAQTAKDAFGDEDRGYAETQIPDSELEFQSELEAEELMPDTMEEFEKYAAKRDFFNQTLVDYFGQEAVAKFEEYGLYNFAQLLGRTRGIYVSGTGQASFDPMKAETVNDVLQVFYHEVGVHHGLEAIIEEVAGKDGWNNFRRMLMKQMTGTVGEHNRQFNRIFHEVKAIYVDSPDVTNPKYLAMRGMKNSELMMNDSFFHEFLGRIASQHDWASKKQPSWAQWLKAKIVQFLRNHGFTVAPTFEEVGFLVQGAVANIIAKDNKNIKALRLETENAKQRAGAMESKDDATWRTSPEKIDTLAPNQVFVFGSNTAGIHGAGAALQAKNKFGAQLGKGRGMTGQTYALPTKSKSGSKLITMPLVAIAREVDSFMAYAAANPDKEFLVTAVGTGLAGYKPTQIAELFKKHAPLPNVLLPASFLGQAAAKPAPAAKPAQKNRAFAGGFPPSGKGTPEGDGKDKAMRKVADSAIVELDGKDRPSSSRTTIKQLGSPDPDSAKVIMLARNGSLKGKPLSEETIADITYFAESAEFVVGDMPGVDSQFVKLLDEIDAKYTIYHTGSNVRPDFLREIDAQPALAAKSAPAAKPAFKSEMEDASLPFASVKGKKAQSQKIAVKDGKIVRTADDRVATPDNKMGDARRVKTAEAGIHRLYGKLVWDEVTDPYETSTQIDNLEVVRDGKGEELQSVEEMGIKLNAPEARTYSATDIKTGIKVVETMMTDAALSPGNNPVGTGAVTKIMEALYNRLAVVADTPKDVKAISGQANKLYSLISSTKPITTTTYKGDTSTVTTEDEKVHAVRTQNIAAGRKAFGYEWSLAIRDIQDLKNAIANYSNGRANIAELLANMKKARIRRAAAVEKIKAAGRYDLLGPASKIPTKPATGLTPVAYMVEKNKQLRVELDKRRATALRVLAEGTKQALHKIYGTVQMVGSLPGSRLSKANAEKISAGNLSVAEKGFKPEEVVGQVNVDFATELVAAYESATEKDRVRKEKIEKEGVSPDSFILKALKPAANTGALIRRELVGTGNTGDPSRRFQAFAQKTPAQIVADIKEGLRLAGVFVGEFAGEATAEHLELENNQLSSFESHDQGQIIAGNMQFLDDAMATVSAAYGAEITLRRGAPMPALGTLQTSIDNNVTELAALRRATERFGEYKGLTVDELFLAVFGLGNPFADNKFIFEGLPKPLLQKYIDAGFAEERKDGIKPIYGLPKVMHDHFGVKYTLYSEIFNLDTPRQTTWLDFSIRPAPAPKRKRSMVKDESGRMVIQEEKLEAKHLETERFRDMRSFGPGAVLMQGDKLFVVGPDYSMVTEKNKKNQPYQFKTFSLHPIVPGQKGKSEILMGAPVKVDEFSLGDYTIVPRFWDLLPTAAVEKTDPDTKKVIYQNHYYLGADLQAAMETLKVRQKLDLLSAQSGLTGIEATTHTQIVADKDGQKFLVLTGAKGEGQTVFKVASSGAVTVQQKYSDEVAMRLVADTVAKAGQEMQAPFLSDEVSSQTKALAKISAHAETQINGLLKAGKITAEQAANMKIYMVAAVKHVSTLIKKPKALQKIYEKMGILSSEPERDRAGMEDFLEKYWPKLGRNLYRDYVKGKITEAEYFAALHNGVDATINDQIEKSGASLGAVAAAVFRMARISRDEREAAVQHFFVEAMRNNIDGEYAETGGRAMSDGDTKNNFEQEDAIGNEGSSNRQAIDLVSGVENELLPEGAERDEFLLQATLKADLPAPADLIELLNKKHGKGAADRLIAMLGKTMPDPKAKDAKPWTIEQLMGRPTGLAPLQTFRLLNMMLALSQNAVTSLGLSHSGLRYATQNAIEQMNVPMANDTLVPFKGLDKATQAQFLDYVGRGPWFKHIWDNFVQLPYTIGLEKIAKKGLKPEAKKAAEEALLERLWGKERLEKLTKNLFPYNSMEKGSLSGLLDDFGGKGTLNLDAIKDALARGIIPLELPYFMSGLPYVDTQAHLSMVRDKLRKRHYVSGSAYAMAEIKKAKDKAEGNKFYKTEYVGRQLFEQTLREQAAEIGINNTLKMLDSLEDSEAFRKIEDAVLAVRGLTVSDTQTTMPDHRIVVATGPRQAEAIDNRKDEDVSYEKKDALPTPNIRFGYTGNPYQNALADILDRLPELGLDAETIVDSVIFEEFLQPAPDGSGMVDPMEAGYFVGTDGNRYSMIADAANFSLEEGGSQEVSDHISPTTGDMALVGLMNAIEPGSYIGDGGGKTGNAGFSPTVQINGKTYSQTLSTLNELSSFGEMLMAKIRQRFDEVLKDPAKMIPSERKRIENLAAQFAQYEEAYGKYEAERLRKGKALDWTTGNLRVGKNRKWNKVAIDSKTGKEIEFSQPAIQFMVKQLLDSLGLWQPGDLANIQIHLPGVHADNKMSFSSVWPSAVLEGLRTDRSKTMSDLKAAAGMVDRNGTVHIFLGALIGADGQLDKRELMKTAFHEFIGHVGLRRLLGAEYDGFMVDVFNKYLRRDAQRAMNKNQMIALAEEFLAGKVEKIRFNEQTGRFENPEVGTAFDRIAAAIMKKFREIMKALGFDVKISGFEVRDLLRQAFAGSQIAGRTGLSGFVPKGWVPMENLTSYADFARWRGNSADNVLKRTADMTRPWTALVRSLTHWDGVDIKENEDILYGMATLKTRIAASIGHVVDEEKAFVAMIEGKNFTYDDVGAVLRALHAQERIKEGVKLAAESHRDKLMAQERLRVIQDELNRLEGYLHDQPDATRPSDDVITKKVKKLREKLGSFPSHEEMVDHLVAGYVRRISQPSRTTRTTREKITDASFFDNDMGSIQAAQLLKIVEKKGLLKVAADGTLSGPMAAAINKIHEHNMQGLQHALDGEMIIQAEYDQLKTKYRYFIPVQYGRASYSSLQTEHGFRLDGPNRFAEIFDGGTGASIENLDPISLSFANLRTRIAEAETNKMNQTIARFALAHPNSEVFGIRTSKAALNLARENQGLKEGDPLWEAQIQKYGFSEIMEGSTYEQRLSEQDNGLIPAYLNGRLVQVEVRHEELRDSYNRFARPERVGRFMSGLGKVNRFMVQVNTLLAPEFWAGQLTRDPGTALTTLAIREKVAGIDGRTFSLQASKRIHMAMKVLYIYNFKKDASKLSAEERLIYDNIERFEKSGGKIQFAMMETALQVEQNLRELVTVADGTASFAVRAKEKGKAAMDMMRKLSDAIENGTRIAVFVTALESGATEQYAAMLSREITVDFDRKGELGQVINTLYMFSNAGIQGTLTIARAITKNPGRAIKVLSAITSFSMAVALMNLAMGDGDDGEPKIYSISDEIRNNHLVFVIPGLDNVVKIPLPYGYAFFHAIGQEIVNSIAGRKSGMAAAAGIMSSFMNNFNPLETAASLGNAHGWIRMIAPTILDPIVDIGMERTPFGTPLMPQKVYEDQPDSARYWRSVSAGSKWAAEGLNELTGGSGGDAGLVSISPETIDSLFATASGGLGKTLQRIFDVVTSPVTGQEIGVNNIPIVRRFVGTPASWEDRGRFYDNFEEIQGVNKTFKNLQKNISSARVDSVKQASIRDMNDFRKMNSHILAMRSTANNVYKQAKSIDEQKERLYKSGLSESEIQPQLKALNERQAKIYQGFNKRYFEVVDNR